MRRKFYKRRYRRRSRRRFTLPSLAALRKIRFRKDDPRVEAVSAAVVFVLVILLARAFFAPSALDFSLDNVQAFRVPGDDMIALRDLSAKYGLDFTQALTVYAAENSFFPTKAEPVSSAELEQNYFMNYSGVKAHFSDAAIAPYYNMLKTLTDEMKCFPVSGGDYMYGDGWENMSGEKFPGTDISDRENIRGSLAVLSMTGGSVTDVGYSKDLGNYIGVTAPSGDYFCYAKLDAFAEGLTEGATLTPGQTLGQATRLHLSVKIKNGAGKKNFWLNPYPFLRLIEE